MLGRVGETGRASWCDRERTTPLESVHAPLDHVASGVARRVEALRSWFATSASDAGLLLRHDGSGTRDDGTCGFPRMPFSPLWRMGCSTPGLTREYAKWV